ncbi:MAG: PilZ domain-containing protein [Desulfobacterales bacterium]
MTPNTEPDSRRNYLRLEYQPEERPPITNRDQTFQVLDISRTGIRIWNDGEIKPKDRIRGQLTLVSGQVLDVEGTVEWKYDNEFGLSLTHLIPASVLEKERTYVISHRS